MASTTQSNVVSEPPAPPVAPREATARARRRAWAEPAVRFWLLVFLAVLLITLSVALSNYRAWARQRDLIVNGTQVDATVQEVDGVSRILRVAPDTPLTLTFTVNGVEQRVQGILIGRTEWITTKEIVPIRVDPSDPQRWTYATEVPSLRREMAMAQLLGPAVLVLLVVVLVLRARTLALWKAGHPMAAVVVTSRHTAMAPFSRYIQATPRDGNAKDLIGVYVPQAITDPQRGDVLWLVVDQPDHFRRALFAGAYS